MEVEAFLNLFDSYWFHLNLFQTKPFKPKKFPEIPTSNPEIPALPTIHTKIPFLEKITSNSPQKLSDSYSSPNSVLLTSKLQTIFSGKISEDFEDYSKSEKEKNPEKIKSKLISSPLKGINPEITNRSRRKKKGLSKSLSDLEFEELKGFMDLGFVFSEEDRDSRLVSIIPGLQKLGKNDDKIEKNDDKCGNNSSISRPYLSETWEVMEKKRKENSLLNWRVPDSNSHVQMKDYLRSWAHTVASTVR